MRVVVLLDGGDPVSDSELSSASALDPVRLSRRDRELWVDGYEWGYQHGIDRGLEIAEEEHRGTWPVSAAIARMVAEAGSYADLCERRGEPERARAQRELLAERGIS